MIADRFDAISFQFNRSTLLGYSIAILALAAAIMTPAVALDQTLLIVFFALFGGICGALILLRWPVLGFVGIIIAAMLIPFSLGTGTETGINAAALLLLVMIGLWIFEMVGFKRQIRLYPSRAVTAALVFIFVSILAFGFGQISWFFIASAPAAAQFGGLMIFVLSAGAFLVAAHKIQSVKELQWMVAVLLGIGFMFFLGRIILPYNVNLYNYFVRQGVLGALFYVWLVAMAFSQAFFNRDLDQKWRIGLVILLLMIFYVNIGITRAWASGWLPPLVAVVIVIFAAKPRTGVILMILGAIFLAINSGLASTIATEGDNLYSITTRLEAWKVLGEMIMVSPIFGLGMANYYYYTPLYSIMGFNIRFNSHNNYIDILAQTGIVGLICFFWFVWEIWRVGWGLRASAREGFSKAYVYGVLGGIAGTVFAGMLGDWVVPFVYNIGLEGFRASVIAWLFMGGLLALQQIEARSRSA